MNYSGISRQEILKRSLLAPFLGALGLSMLLKAAQVAASKTPSAPHTDDLTWPFSWKAQWKLNSAPDTSAHCQDKIISINYTGLKPLSHSN